MTLQISVANKTINILLLFAICTSLASAEANLPTTIKELRYELDVVLFDLPKEGDHRLNRLEELSAHSETLAIKHKNDAAFQLMAGLFNAQYAGHKGGIGALKYAKASRKHLEKSIELDPSIYGASAHIVLGALYAQVPGWPVGFGNKKKAVKNYQAALQLSPDGIDSNFSYALYLFGQKEYAKARTYLEKAALAPPRPDRAKADEDLKKQITKGLEEINKRLSDG